MHRIQPRSAHDSLGCPLAAALLCFLLCRPFCISLCKVLREFVHEGLAVAFGMGVDAEGVRAVGGSVGLFALAIEHIIGRDMDDTGPVGLRGTRQIVDPKVVGHGKFLIVIPPGGTEAKVTQILLGPVHRIIGSGVDDQRWPDFFYDFVQLRLVNEVEFGTGHSAQVKILPQGMLRPQGLQCQTQLPTGTG